MSTQKLQYAIEHTEFEGFLITHDGLPRPGVMLCHAWGGLLDYEKGKAEIIAALGYNVLAIDLYGKGVRGAPNADNSALMAPFLNDRALLRSHLLASLNVFTALPEIKADCVAAVGYCFGGLCALDLARSGANVKGVVSVHGLFNPPGELANEMIKAKVLALHGYEDPLVPPDNVAALAKEFTDAGVDWQLHAYGMTYHAFTNPAANNPSMGAAYNPIANARAEKAIEAFLKEVLV